LEEEERARRREAKARRRGLLLVFTGDGKGTRSRWPGRPSRAAATGRGATGPIIEAADLVTEMREVKHHLEAGIPAQRGIEF
jgi:ATP:corrinoid adenosyltransferase